MPKKLNKNKMFFVKFSFCCFILLTLACDLYSKQKKDLYFPASRFNDWLIKAEFDKNNVPTYAFFYDNKKSWEIKNSNQSEYVYDGYTSYASGVPLNYIKYYQYRGKNIFTNGAKDLPSDFYFYFFTARGAGIIPLNFHLIAIDIYSKDIYMYAIPIDTKKYFGKPVPLNFIAIDLYETNGRIYHFYEYDPIGKVEKDGNVTLYNFFKDRQSKNIYNPVYTGKSPHARKK